MKQLNSRQQALLNMLADGNFHSGEQIGTVLGISRAAISQQIKSLRQLGIEVFSITGKGYRLNTPLQLLNPDILRQHLSGAPVHTCAVIDSTNHYMMAQLDRWQKGECVLAEMQTAGRGRRGRQWHSPFGSQFIMSMYWRLDDGPGAAMGLSLAIGVAVVRALEAQGYHGLSLKWPNDIYMSRRKLAGILVEMSAAVGGLCHLVIGIGINLNLSDEVIAQLDQPCAHLAEQPIMVDRNRLSAAVIQELRNALALFERQGLSAFLTEWNRLDMFMQQPVKVLLGEQVIQGIYCGIDTEGNMLLQDKDGVRKFVGGEISLRADH
ncbi:MAG: bifunctional biotin--[acetyl-CoA-carboxylase] ligase/biotin operon repressor BirA [Gammaproteobacteria bacterium]|uniref:Bifunctional ligase/repressor BirA n=1 Tax=Tolumonas osonensis TaxID=675874 RepID=A0A841GP66_9GAMM|nr:bifunctional biotin--[acetyl-CoA-carboxylase] ligase/biotin operon repressor BirA [Tolumonas osonensis]MBB6056630.1 BirA family biotin operon repressor/biotin-[acetyl-CoA-carboxylase] ligase [Tolumonas osonensis]NCB58894.1 bifunctional biotin--[acetyl-CoA-carboxylase] ligase/biotin operon repressor BirA [Gammaproteobacteria bacterium]